jgi:2,5-dihydroxypyridine 5,6-dioxygenase
MDAELMRRYFDASGDREAFGVSQVGWSLSDRARHEARALYDRENFNGTELRALAGNFLCSTGANEFAARDTEGHFDLPLRGCSLRQDDAVVAREGRLA